MSSYSSTMGDKRARAYDHVQQLVESAPEAAAKALLTAIFNYLSADDFCDMVEREFEWEDEEDSEDDDTEDDGDTWIDEEE